METQADRATLLYLASESPRRQELMQQLNLQFEVVKAPIEEVVLPEETPQAYVKRIAQEKAQAGFAKLPPQLSEAPIWVVGGDTAVVLEGQVFGKPANDVEAKKMLSMLSGQTHQVLSSLAVLCNDNVYSAISTTQVTFKNLTKAEIDEYWLTGEPEGKAGGYAIQGLGAKFIESIDGSYSGVMGLPLYELNQLLIESGYVAETHRQKELEGL